MMEGYKVFDPDWKCRGFQYKVGETYEMEEHPVIRKCGFHFCEKLDDCFNYYLYDSRMKIAKVEALGEISEFTNIDSDKCTNKIKIISEIPWKKISEYIGLEQPSEVEVEKITLLSAEEYEKKFGYIRPSGLYWWWLRSPGGHSDYAAIVYFSGGVSSGGCYVHSIGGAVRPALIINPESTNLQVGDRIFYKQHRWTAIDKNMLLCDEPVTYMPFRKDWKAPDANDYEHSDVKKWLEDWAKTNGILR